LRRKEREGWKEEGSPMELFSGLDVDAKNSMARGEEEGKSEEGEGGGEEGRGGKVGGKKQMKFHITFHGTFNSS
jgi:hypothetical protein